MANEEEPCPVRWKSETTYKTLVDWLDSEDYPPELDAYLRKVASDRARDYQRKRMPFALVLQGIIDHRDILNIPRGTDLFGESSSKYLRLIEDFTSGLVDRRNTDQFERLATLAALKPGDKIIAYRWAFYKEKYGMAAKRNIGRLGDGPFVFTVHHVDLPRNENGYPISGTIFVHDYECNKRWSEYSWNRDSRYASPITKKLGIAPVSSTQWVPVGISSDLAARLLDDRQWKRSNTFAVPLLAQWGKVKQAIESAAPGEVAPVRVVLKDETDIKEEDAE